MDFLDIFEALSSTGAEVLASLEEGLLDLDLDAEERGLHLVDFLFEIPLEGVEVDALVVERVGVGELLGLFLVDLSVDVLFVLPVLVDFLDRLLLRFSLCVAHQLHAEESDGIVIGRMLLGFALEARH